MKKTIIAIAVLLFAAVLFTGSAAADTDGMIGGESGTIHVHTNVPGAKVAFYLINIEETGQPMDIQYADANGDVYFKVYTTATPPKYVLVTAPGYIQDITSQASITAPGPGETVTYDIPLKPISPTPLPPTSKSPAPVFAVIAALGLAGAVAVLRRN
ncbi:MAG TPA: hypothetical protein O0X97_02090 [Methanocorpusculum sp.]|nr:hypothetical protein [Methanocorpusculum sp.]